MTTRWQAFYTEDPRLAQIGPSQAALYAAQVFRRARLQRVLDLGCGTGRDSVVLAEAGLSVVSIDAARSGLELARRRAGELRMCQCDARRIPVADASFDAVYCFGLLHEFVSGAPDHDVADVTREVQRVLKPEGHLVLAVVAGDPAAGLPHLRMFSEAMFDAACAGFRCVEKARYDDLGCTGRPNYPIWRGWLVKPA